MKGSTDYTFPYLLAPFNGKLHRNLYSRVSFTVVEKVDSTILTQNKQNLITSEPENTKIVFHYFFFSDYFLYTRMKNQRKSEI